VEPATIQRKLLCSIRTSEQLATLRSRYNLKYQDFVFYPQEAEFLFNQINEYGTPPDRELWAVSFSEFLVEDSTENFDFLAQLMVWDRQHRMMVSSCAAAVTGSEKAVQRNADPQSYITRLVGQLSKLSNTGKDFRGVLDGASAKERLRRYAKALDDEPIEIYKTGIEPLDRIPLPITDGTSIGIMGDTNTGKSWLATRVAATFYHAGHKVLIISPEMSKLKLELRSDVALGRLMGYELSFNALFFGREQKDLLENYEKFLSEVEGRSDWVNYDKSMPDAFTVSTIDSIITKEKPKLVIVDGVYCMSDEENNRTSWERMKAMCNGLHSIAGRHNLVIIVTNQVSKDSSREGAPDKSAAADGYYYSRILDLVISVGEMENSPGLREVRVVKNRDDAVPSSSYQVTFEPNIGNIGEFPRISQRNTFDDRVRSV
jgi:predicted ATP-dependent serine protease